MTESMLTFLQECHLVMSKNYDNSLKIPFDIMEKYGGLGQIQGEWISYLKYKFRYFTLLETDSEDKADAKISLEIKNSRKGYLTQFIPEWKALAENEQVVCSYRYCQLPKEVVENMWYYQQVEECHDWCTKRRLELDQLDAQAKENKWVDKLQEIYKEIGSKPLANYRQERLLSVVFKEAIGGLVERVNSVRRYLKENPSSLAEVIGPAAESCQQIINQVAECLSCFKDTPFKRVAADTSLIDNDFLAELSLKLMEVLHSSGFDEIAVITEFLHSLRNHFQCEVCDFLEATDENRKVVWRAATVNHNDLSPQYRRLPPDQLRQKILERESYGKGIGISGSVLLLDDDIGRNIWYHVGSNDVIHDPRQSEEHRTAYEKDIYPGVLKANGKINNFWMFPIFEGGRLMGAFRVVNKNTGGGKLQPGGWPYFTRVQLALIAQWFSRFLETTRPQMQAPEDYIAIMERNQRIDKLMAKLRLDWVQKRPLQAFLRHLTRDITKKQEKRSIGCCILVTNITEGEWPLEELGAYPFLDCLPGAIVEPYDGLDAYHDAINPLIGGYVFDQNGRFIRVARLECHDQAKIVSGYQAIEWITKQHNKTICLLLPRDSKNILVYQGGKRVAEVHASETTAEWRFRYPDEILERMTSWAPNVDTVVLKTICDASIELSFRGWGAIMVVGDIQLDKFSFSMPKIPYKSECRLSDLGGDFLVEFAKMDGATFITKDGYVTKVNRNITPVKDPGLKPLFPGRGNRHEISEKISKLAPEALVIIVSENRGISIVASGGAKIAREL